MIDEGRRTKDERRAECRVPNAECEMLPSFVLRPSSILVKLGGEIMLNGPGLEGLASDIATLSREGVGVVVVHGGGPQADALSQKLGHTVRKVAGRRVTDDDALQVAKMVYAGSINVDLLAALRKHGAKAVGISGVDGNLITVKRRPPTLVRDAQTGNEQQVDFGHVGDIAAVDAGLLGILVQAGYVPVVASLAADEQGNVYNVNADTIASALAAALQADTLFLVTNVPGVLRDPSDPGSLLATCTKEEITALVEQGVISGGMLPKVHNSLQALQDGVKSVCILDGTGSRSLLLPGLRGDRLGTTITS